MPWFDFDGAHYAHALTSELEKLWCALSDQKPAWCDFRLTKAYQQAATTLRFLQHASDDNEVCAITKGNRVSEAGGRAFDAEVLWLGVDIYVSGYGSAISEGIFSHPDLFPDFLSKINPYGLFDSTDEIIHQLQDRYAESARTEEIEPMPANKELWHQLVVGRVPAETLGRNAR